MRSHLGSERTEGRSPTETDRLAASYASFVEQKEAIERQKQTAALRSSIGGWIGVALEYVFKPLDFDWRTNITLVARLRHVLFAGLGYPFPHEETFGSWRGLHRPTKARHRGGRFPAQWPGEKGLPV